MRPFTVDEDSACIYLVSIHLMFGNTKTLHGVRAKLEPISKQGRWHWSRIVTEPGSDEGKNG